MGLSEVLDMRDVHSKNKIKMSYPTLKIAIGEVPTQAGCNDMWLYFVINYNVKLILCKITIISN